MMIWQKVLQHVRVYGPCSQAEIRRTTGLDRCQVCGAVRALRDEGLVERIDTASYDVTELGRQLFDQIEQMPLLKDE